MGMDSLGSTRLVTAVNGSLFDSLDYLPLGEQIAGGTGSSDKFTGKERDAETGNDNFGARYCSSNVGRFISPDWSAKVEPVPYAKLDNPQSLNLYSYVYDNPLSRADSDGHIGNCAPGLNGTAQTTTCKQKIAGQTEAQEKPKARSFTWNRFLSYFYLKGGNGQGIGVTDLKIGPARVDFIDRKGKDVTQTTDGKETKNINKLDSKRALAA